MFVKLFFQAKEWFQSVVPMDEKAQGLVEYALIIVLIAVVVIGALTLLGDEVQDVFQRIVDGLSGAGATVPEG